MEILIDFPAGSKVEAHFGSFSVLTDQPPDSSAPTPFDLFLASIGTCAGLYCLRFCRQRDLPVDGLQVIEHVVRNPMSGMVERIDLDVRLPKGFPDKYREAVIHSAQACAVKKHLEHPPALEITACVG